MSEHVLSVVVILCIALPSVGHATPSGTDTHRSRALVSGHDGGTAARGFPALAQQLSPSFLVAECEIQAARASAMQIERIVLASGAGSIVHPDRLCGRMFDLMQYDLNAARQSAASTLATLSVAGGAQVVRERLTELQSTLEQASRQADKIRSMAGSHQSAASDLDRQIQTFIAQMQAASDLLTQAERRELDLRAEPPTHDDAWRSMNDETQDQRGVYTGRACCEEGVARRRSKVNVVAPATEREPHRHAIPEVGQHTHGRNGHAVAVWQRNARAVGDEREHRARFERDVRVRAKWRPPKLREPAQRGAIPPGPSDPCSTSTSIWRAVVGALVCVARATVTMLTAGARAKADTATCADRMTAASAPPVMSTLAEHSAITHANSAISMGFRTARTLYHFVFDRHRLTVTNALRNIA